MVGGKGPNRIALLGSLNMDLVVRVGRLPGPGETVLGRGFLAAGGGKGANQAVAAARLGARVRLLGCVGSDLYGRELLRLARGAGVDVGHVRRLPGATGVAAIVVGEDGQNQIAVAPGANGLVTPELVAAAGDSIRQADLLVAQLEVPLEAVAAAARCAEEAGVPVLLNAAPARTDLQTLLPLVTLLVVNEGELATLVGRPVPEGGEGEAAGDLLEGGPRAILVTLGARGALLVEGSGSRRIPAFPVEAVDSTGAGDAFVGGLAARYRGLDSLEGAALYAAAAGALACTRPGAQPSLPTAQEVEAFLSPRRPATVDR